MALPQQGSGAPLAASMLGGVRGPGADEEGDDNPGREKEFDEPLCALVQNCTVLHNIVGPACIFLRQGFAQSQIVRTDRQTHRTAPSPHMLTCQNALIQSQRHMTTAKKFTSNTQSTTLFSVHITHE